MKGSLPITVSYDASRPSYRDTCVDVSADLRFLDLSAGIFYQWKSCWWSWVWFRCRWGTRHTLYSFGRSSAFSLRRNMIYKCFWSHFAGRSECCEVCARSRALFNWVSKIIWKYNFALLCSVISPENSANPSTNQMHNLHLSWLGRPRFPRLRRVACFYFELSLVLYGTFISTDWPLWFFSCFGFTTLNWRAL